jgi:2-polyprenyl-6-methoxyphenol hydroxylase-like FAD-dependent oxidoreductase
MALARKGHDVVLVERDGPPPEGRFEEWDRHGVMQFRLPHFFRHFVRHHLLEDLPEVWEALVEGGGVPVRPDGFPEEMTGLEARRSTFERVWWSEAARQPGLSLVAGYSREISLRGDRVAGVIVDGELIESDLVIVATGRSTHLGDEHRAPGEGGPCGFSYAARMYRAKDGVEPPSSALPIGAIHHGYQTIVFPQDDRTLSALFVRPTADSGLAGLRHVNSFEAAARQVPNLAPWTDLERFEPITPVMAGSGLSNTYRGGLNEHGTASVAGLFFVGDTVCTTNPAAGRGVSLGLSQAAELVRLLGHDADNRSVAEHFETWRTEHIQPWYEDHVYWDATLLSRFGGEDIDVEGRLPSDVICAAALQDPSMFSVVGPFMGMLVTPTALREVEEAAREVLRSAGDRSTTRDPTRPNLLKWFSLNRRASRDVSPQTRQVLRQARHAIERTCLLGLRAMMGLWRAPRDCCRSSAPTTSVTSAATRRPMAGARAGDVCTAATPSTS